jgi:thiamine-monophosphate kinase
MEGSGWSEDRLHAWMRRALATRALRAGFGNDAAALRARLLRPVVCVDQTVEGVHWTAGMPARRIGRKAAARALSDLAASAAEPRALLLALSLPPGLDERFARELVRAVRDRARESGAELVGGDLSCARGPLTIAVTALGLGPPGPPPARSAARPGELVVLTGPTGGSLLGRHLDCEPRLAAGRWLWERGARAMLDVSDGLARDVGRLARLSGVAIDLERVPIHADARRAAQKSGRSALDHALYDGEDYELVATMPAARARDVERAARRLCPGLVVVGRVRAGSGVRVPVAEGERRLRRAERRGWMHGG